jgi:hypothetical protein
MEKYIPQKDSFNMALILDRLSNGLLWLSFFLSIISTFEKYWNQINYISTILIIFNIIVIIAILILQISKRILLHKAENIRRDCMIDNALGTSIAEEASIGYFDNDEIQAGLKKLLANVYQNSVFSYEIVSAMINKRICPTILMALPLVVFSVIGFINLTVSIPLLQLFVSGLVLMKFIDLFYYKRNVEWVKEKAQNITTNLSQHSTIDKFGMAQIIQLVLRYETNIAMMQIILDGKIHEKKNARMTFKWTTVKERQNIH